MKIENGITSTILNTEELAAINEKFNITHPDIDATISINVNLHEDMTDDRDECDSEQHLKEFRFRYVLFYTHPLSQKKRVHIAFEQTETQMDIHEGIQATLDVYLKQTRTCKHAFTRPKDVFGCEYPDGRGFCAHCELELPGVLPQISGVQVISMSLDQDVVAQHDWGNAHIQGGHKGIAFSADNTYTTSFMEAFPSVHGFGTFLRGEGENIHLAEDRCWASYQKKLQCPGHEWSRHVHGHHRTDGYAQCIHCQLCTSEALQPETLCVVCQTPTTQKHNDTFFCLTHYCELPEDERVTAYINMRSNSDTSDSDKAKYRFDHLFISRIEIHAFKLLGSDRYNAIKNTLRSVLAFVKHNFYTLVLNTNALKRGYEYDSASYEKMVECHAHIIQNWDIIQEYLDCIADHKNSGAIESRELRGVSVNDVIPAQYIRKKEVQS